MHNPEYRLAAAWQNVGYNQPSEPGFYLGPDRRGRLLWNNVRFPPNKKNRACRLGAASVYGRRERPRSNGQGGYCAADSFVSGSSRYR